MSFTGTTVWITGASSGIGEACAYEFARRGARLVLSARNAEKLEAVKQACPRPNEVAVVPLDLSENAGYGALVRQVWSEHGPVDIYLGNGGLSQRAWSRDTNMDTHRYLMEVNFFGHVALTRALLPLMRERGKGHFAMVSSLVGKFGFKMRTGYAASKHALHGFYDSLRLEEHDAGIGVTMICPGFIRTELSKVAMTGDGKPQGSMDNNQAGGMPPEVCARKMADAIAAGKHEVAIGGKERFGVLLKRFFPGVLYRMSLKQSAQ